MKTFPKIARIPPDSIQLPNGAWSIPQRQIDSENRGKLRSTAHLIPIPIPERINEGDLEVEQLKLELQQLQKP